MKSQFFPARNLALTLATLALFCFMAPGATAAPTLDGVVNINQASATELALLPGIGASKAGRIVLYRAKRPFKKAVELARVKGIGLKTVRKLKSYLRVEGRTTLKRSATKAAKVSKK